MKNYKKTCILLVAVASFVAIVIKMNLSSDYSYHGFLPKSGISNIVSLPTGESIEWDGDNHNLFISKDSASYASLNWLGETNANLKNNTVMSFFQSNNNIQLMKGDRCYLSNYGRSGCNKAYNSVPAFGDRLIILDLTIIDGNNTFAFNYNLQNVNGYYRLYLAGDKTIIPGVDNA